jgi:phage-related protein
MGVITYNGISSDSLGIIIELVPDYSSAEFEADSIHVPGRNGDIILGNGSYKNTSVSYSIAIVTKKDDLSFSDACFRIANWLHSAISYVRLEDTYEPDYYRMAVYVESTAITNVLLQAGRATITFNCKPQRFYKSGENAVSFLTSGSLLNPSKQIALPISKIYGSGSGTFTLNNQLVSISEINTYTTINSDLQDAYTGNTNRNSYVTCTNFPTLKSGINYLSFTGGVTKIEVTPNWWTV